VAAKFSEILIRLTSDPRLALNLYSAIFFPGVLLHEGSHWLASLALGVRPEKFSLGPRLMCDGRYRLGYVETRRPDPLRGALIGAAPLAAGATVLLLIGLNVLHLDDVAWAVQQGAWGAGLERLRQIPRFPLVGLWIYLAVAVGQTMLPSRADRSLWLPLAALAAAALLLGVWAGLGPQLALWLLPPVTSGVRTLAGALTITVALDLALSLPLAALGALARGLPSRGRGR
jgi:hypothetical protein